MMDSQNFLSRNCNWGTALVTYVTVIEEMKGLFWLTVSVHHDGEDMMLRTGSRTDLVVSAGRRHRINEK